VGGGPTPERINGRLAMVGFVAAMAVELSRGQDLSVQKSKSYGLNQVRLSGALGRTGVCYCGSSEKVQGLGRLKTTFPFSFLTFISLKKKKTINFKIFITFFTFYITSTLFYYFLNKKLNTIIFFFLIFHINYFNFISHQFYFSIKKKKKKRKKRKRKRKKERKEKKREEEEEEEEE
jgi:hypothetical protein